MGTLIYSPGVRILIAPDYPRRGNVPRLLETTEDVSTGGVKLAPCSGNEGGSTVSFTLLNNRRKYDGIFTPGDRIAVYLKRLRWLRVFSGYLSSVPYYGVYAPTVSLTANCRISKKFLYSLYDPGSVAFDELMLDTYGEIQDDSTSPDTGMAERITGIINAITGLPEEQMHIGGIPHNWAALVDEMLTTLEPDLVAATASFAAGGTVAGESLTSLGTFTAMGADGQPDRGPLYGTMPYTTGSAVIPTDISSGYAQLSSATLLSNDWTVAIRIPALSSDGEALGTPAEVATALHWWRDRKILVVNPATNRAVVARLVAWGPPVSTGSTIAVSQLVGSSLGIQDGGQLQIRFAALDANLGPATPLGVNTGLIGASSSTTTTATTQVTADGLTFMARADNGGTLQPNANAAWQFIEQVWPEKRGRVSGYRRSGSVPNSLHPRGLALDIGAANGGGTEPTDAQVAVANSIVWWFCQNPNAFGVYNIIWNNQVYDSSGVRPYSGNGNDIRTAQYGHRDHIHIGFRDTQQRAIGAMGSPWPVTVGDFLASSARGGVIAGVPRATTIGSADGTSVIAQADSSQLGFDSLTGVEALTTSLYWTGSQGIQALSDSLVGPRLLMNDQPFMPFANSLFGVAMREYGTAPNGDLIAWFPDYHNLYGTCARLVVQPIELEAFAIQWSDQSMTTHQFVVGSWGSGFGVPDSVAALSADRRLETRGVVTVEQPSVMEALLNIPREGNDWTDPITLLSRFGARVNTQGIPWAATPRAEFWNAVDLFRRNWAAQFTCQVKTSFLPEAFPGMILQLPAYGMQFYIRSVSHDWSLGDGGSGFSTTISVMAPSTIGNSGPPGFPRGGAWIGSDNPGAPSVSSGEPDSGVITDAMRGIFW